MTHPLLDRLLCGFLLGLALALPTAIPALAAAAPTGDSAQPLDVLLQQADAYEARGQYRNALAVLRTAQPLADSLDPARRAALLGALGKALWLTGATEEARRELERSIALARQANASRIAAASLNDLGNLAAERGDGHAARAAYEDSLHLARQAQDSALVATVLINAARLEARAGDARRAETRLAEAARAVEALPDSHDKAFDFLAIGQLRRNLPGAAAAQRARAVQDFTAAETLARRLGDQRNPSYALGYQGQWQQEEGHAAEALALYRQAVFAAQQADAPELLYRWQWAIGRLLKAQGDRDGAIVAYQQAVANLQAIRQDFTLDRSRGAGSFRTSVGDAFVELADLLLQRAARSATPAAREADLLAARDTMEALKTAEVRDYFQDECVTALQARTVALDRPPPQTAILYPIVLPDRLELLLQSPAGIRQVTVRVDRATFTGVVYEFRRYLEKRTSREYLPLAQQLYGWLIQPVQSELDAQHIETLVIAPDGPLRTIPMAALHDGQVF